LINSNIKSFLTTKDLKKLKRIFHTLKSKKEAQFEIELIGKENNIFTVSINSQIINFENKQIIYGTLRDLSQENENMLLLERSRRIFQNLKEGVII
jgi:predicted ribosome-associated RNA-binding protein Tma20